MAQKLSDAIVKALPAPPKGNRVTYDADVRGFGCRITATALARSFWTIEGARAGIEEYLEIKALHIGGL